jgi:hypothetical protein
LESLEIGTLLLHVRFFLGLNSLDLRKNFLRGLLTIKKFHLSSRVDLPSWEEYRIWMISLEHCKYSSYYLAAGSEQQWHECVAVAETVTV